MNTLKGQVISVESQTNLSLVRVDADGIVISAVVTDTPSSAPYLNEGSVVAVLFKEGDVIIGKGPVNVSLRNQIPATVSSIEHGQLLSKIHLLHEHTNLASIITSKSVKRLNLQKGDQVMAMIKTNEILIADT